MIFEPLVFLPSSGKGIVQYFSVLFGISRMLYTLISSLPHPPE